MGKLVKKTNSVLMKGQFMNHKEDKLLTRKEIMAILRINSVNTFYKIEKYLKSIKVGGKFLYSKLTLIEYLKSQELIM